MFWHEICRCYSHPVESPTMLRQYIMSYCSLWILPRNFWFKIDNCLKLLKSLNFLAVSKRKGSQSILAMVQMSMDLIIILINKKVKSNELKCLHFGCFQRENVADYSKSGARLCALPRPTFCCWGRIHRCCC